MNIVKVTKRKDGSARVIIDLKSGEPVPNRFFNDDAHYRLGYPLNEVVAGHILAEAVPVHWCPLGQEWVE